MENIYELDSIENDKWIQEKLKNDIYAKGDQDSVPDQLLYANFKQDVMAVMTTQQGKQTWSRASIDSMEDNKYSVTFDDYNMQRENVPMTELLPIPEELLKLPCWLFESVPGGGCD